MHNFRLLTFIHPSGHKEIFLKVSFYTKRRFPIEFLSVDFFFYSCITVLYVAEWVSEVEWVVEWVTEVDWEAEWVAEVDWVAERVAETEWVVMMDRVLSVSK